MQKFELALFCIVCVCAATMLYCRYVKPEIGKRSPEPWFLDYARSFFPVLLLVFLLRGFVAEPFRIPSGSMLPNLEIGDFILVNKFSYGVRLPIVHTKILSTNEPERGDIVVFRYPPEPSVNYIKRLIGKPGDTIRYDDGSNSLYVNGELVGKQSDGEYQSYGARFKHKLFKQEISRDDGRSAEFPVVNFPRDLKLGPSKVWVVPEGHYFMMGDNRDNSADSRSKNFTFVPDENIVGRAFFIWMHYNTKGGGFKFSRIGAEIEASLKGTPDKTKS